MSSELTSSDRGQGFSESPEVFFSGSEFDPGLRERIHMVMGMNDEAANPQVSMDLIKADISTLKPREQTQLEARTDSIDWIIRQNIGAYVSAEKLREMRDISRRIVVAKQEDVERLFLEENLMDSSQHLDGKLSARVLTSPDGIIIARPNLTDDIGWRIASHSLKKQLIDKNGGSVRDARKEASERYLISLLYGSITELYVRNDLPKYIQSAAGYYFAAKLYDGFKENPNVNRTAELRKKNFAKLVEKHGDDFLRYIFGESIPTASIGEILKDIDSFDQFPKLFLREWALMRRGLESEQ